MRQQSDTPGSVPNGADITVENLKNTQAEQFLQQERLREAERSLMEVELRYQQLYKKYCSLFDFAPMGYLVVEAAGTIREANLTAAALLGLSKVELTGKCVTDFIHPDYQDEFRSQKDRCARKKESVGCDLLMVARGGQPFTAYLLMQGHPSLEEQEHPLRIAFNDVSEQLQLSRDLFLSHQCLKIALESTDIEPMLRDFVSAIKSYLKCDAVGVRLLDEKGRAPYAACDGFSNGFFDKEKRLSIGSDRGMCIDVLKGRVNPEKSFFTPWGSFHTRAFSAFLKAFPPEEPTCQACNEHRYESVALIPVRADTHIFGLIHVADRREKMIPLGVIQELERAAMRMAMSIQRFKNREKMESSTQELAYLSSRMLKVQEDEQRRIAVELHDQTGQNLNVLKLQLASIYNRMTSDQQGLRNDFLRTQELVSQIIEDIRRISHGLSPAALDVIGLAAAVRELGAEFQDYAGVQVQVDVEALDLIAKRNTRIVVYRIFQEALTNISKHAGASRVDIHAREEDGRIVATIQDNGCGFDARRSSTAENRPRGLGLDAMQLRARMIGAAFELSSRPGEGTRIELIVPTNSGKNADE